MYIHNTEHQTARQILAQSIKLYLRSFLKVLPFSILIAILGFIPNLTAYDPRIPLTPWESVWLYFVFSFIGVYIAAVMLNIFQMMADEKPVSYREALRNAASCYGRLFLATLCIYIINAFAFSFLYFPGLIIGIVTYMAIPYVVLKKQPPFTAIQNAFLLVSRRWWQTLAVLFIPAILILLSSGLTRNLHPHHYIASFIIMFIAITWLNSALFCQFHNLQAKPCDAKQEAQIRVLLRDRPKAVYIAFICILVFVINFMGVHLGTLMVNMHDAGSSLSLESVVQTLMLKLTLPGSIMCLPFLFGVFTFFGSYTCRYLAILFAVLVTIFGAFMLIDGHHYGLAILSQNQLDILNVVSVILNVIYVICLVLPSTHHWFKQMHKTRIGTNEETVPKPKTAPAS